MSAQKCPLFATSLTRKCSPPLLWFLSLLFGSWAWAAPSPPAAPTFSGITATSVVVKAPALPTGATSLTLQKKLSSQADTTYSSLATGQTAASSYTSSGLTVGTGYSFRYLGVGSTGSTAGTAAGMITKSQPSAPSAPVFSNVKSTTLTVTAPTLPSNADTLTLQQKLATDLDTAYVANATGLAGGAVTNLSNVTPSTNYAFRYVAVSGAATTAGTAATQTTLAAPGVAGAPLFSSVTSTGLTATAPALPSNTDSLTLQKKLSTELDTAYVNVFVGLAGAAVKSVTGLSAGATYTFRYLGVSGTANTPGTTANVTTVPSVPAAPTLSNNSTNSIVVTTPTTPIGVTSLTVQQKLSSAADTTYANIATGVAGNTVVTASGLSLATSYTFRCLGIWSGGTLTGATATMTTLGDAPDELIVVSRAQTSIRFALPLLPVGATSLSLQKKLPTEADTAYANVTTGLAGGIQTDSTGLSSATTYVFRCVAFGSGGGNPGAPVTVATTGSAPVAPGIPTFSAIGFSGVTITAPALPTGATTLNLQRKLTSEADSVYVQVVSAMTGGATFGATGLLSATSYTFRFVAVGDGGLTTGTGASVTTTISGTAPGAPGAPTFSGVGATGLKATAPILPANSTELRLQRKLVGAADTSYIEVGTGLTAGSVSVVTELQAATGYTFRYVALGVGNGATAGTSADVTTLGAPPSSPKAPRFAGYTSTSIAVMAPALPAGATSLTLYQKHIGALDSSYTVAATNVAGGATVNVTGLIPMNTPGADSSYTYYDGYTFYFAAVNANGSTPGFPATINTSYNATPAPGVPNAPIVSSDFYVTYPALPANATSLILQRKLTALPDWNYETDNAGFEQRNPTQPATSYTFRFVAVGTGGQTPGPSVSATTLDTNYGGLGAPHFGPVTNSTIIVLAPPLPPGTTSLSLQRLTSTNPDVWADVATGLSGGASTTVTGLTAQTGYVFRYTAIKVGGNIVGPSASGYTSNSATATGPVAPVVVVAFGDGFQVKSVSNQYLQIKLSTLGDYFWSSVSSTSVSSNQGTVLDFRSLSSGTSYSLRWTNSSGGFGATVTATTAVMPAPLPGTPPVPVVNSFTAGQIQFTVPTIPVYASFLILQYQINGQGTFYEDTSEVFASASPYTFTPNANTTYVFRWVAVGAGGRTVGATTAPIVVPLGPDAPGDLTLGTVTDTTVTITMPPLPPRATSLRLQSGYYSYSSPTPQNPYPVKYANFSDVSVGGSTVISGGATVTVTGLSSARDYLYRCVAVGDARTLGAGVLAVTTLSNVNAPVSPVTPTFSSITGTSITVTLPPLSLRATSLTLQKKNPDDATGWSTADNVATGQAAGASISLTGLIPGAFYLFRVTADNASGSTAGPVIGVQTGMTPPAAPSFSNITSSSVDVTAPPLPDGAILETLHMKVTGRADDTYERVGSGLLGGSVTTVSGLSRNTSYTFRFIAYSASGNGYGPEAPVVTAATGDSWIAGSPIQCGGISWPSNGAVISAGTEGVLTSFLATDWDARSGGGTSNSLLSDPCSYTWSASGGSFKNGVNRGQNATWIAPTVPGTYTLTLTVDDQLNTNIAPGDLGSRHTNPDATNDSPLTFSVSVTVN